MRPAVAWRRRATLAAFRHDAGPGWVHTAPILFEAPPATPQPEVRTLSVSGSDIVMNVGGGLTHGSTADGEWEEALWKAAYVQGLVRRA